MPKPARGFAPGPHQKALPPGPPPGALPRDPTRRLCPLDPHPGLCPGTPPPFEKGGRKLHFGLGIAQPTRGFAPGPLPTYNILEKEVIANEDRYGYFCEWTLKPPY